MFNKKKLKGNAWLMIAIGVIWAIIHCITPTQPPLSDDLGELQQALYKAIFGLALDMGIIVITIWSGIALHMIANSIEEEPSSVRPQKKDS